MHYARLIEANYVRDYVIYVRFKDGIAGEIDLADCLWGEMFEPLKDRDVFKSLRVDPEIHTVVWPNGADVAPEFLYERAMQLTNQSMH